eukprot:365326-Chlamydomonas_euryale.AAC.9
MSAPARSPMPAYGDHGCSARVLARTAASFWYGPAASRAARLGSAAERHWWDTCCSRESSPACCLWASAYMDTFTQNASRSSSSSKGGKRGRGWPSHLEHHGTKYTTCWTPYHVWLHQRASAARCAACRCEVLHATSAYASTCCCTPVCVAAHPRAPPRPLRRLQVALLRRPTQGEWSGRLIRPRQSAPRP